MRAFLAVLLVTALLLSGCASKGKDKDGGDASSTSTSASTTKTSTAGTSSSASSTGTGAPTANQAPTGGISLVVNGTRVAFNLTGSDQDGDSLSWTLAFGDGNATQGTSLPALANHTFAAGNYTAVYNLTDGKAPVSYMANFTVAGTAAAGVQQVIHATWPVPNGACGADYPSWPVGQGADGGAWYEAAVDPATIGKAYTATFQYTDPTGGLLSAVAGDFYAADGSFIDGGYFEFSPATTATGTVPAGAAFVVFYDCVTAGGTVVDYVAG